MKRSHHSKIPWVNTWNNINDRCTRKKNYGYPWYGAKGIKNLISVGELEFLWFRDRAYFMDKPSIDRLNSSKDYQLDNCRYVEQHINCGHNRDKKECINGHPFEGNNIYIEKNGYRQCLICKKNRAKKCYKKKLTI